MKMKPNLLWLAMASLALPVTASAEIYRNHVELGVGHVSDDNGKLGEFSEELEDEGSFVVGSLYLEDGADDGSYKTYLEFSNNRGEAGYVRPGDFKAAVFGYQSQKISKFETVTAYPGSKTSAVSYLPMPADPIVVAGRRGPEYAGDYSDPDIYGLRTFKVERHTYGLDMTKYLGSNWSVNLGYSHQKKDGVKSQGNHGNDLILPIDVDYEHDQYNMGVEYNGDRLAVGANLYYSHFKDRHSSIEYELWGGDPDSGPAVIETEKIATEPDNQFLSFALDGLYHLGERTALNWIVNWSSATQDEDFVRNGGFTTQNLDGQITRFNGRITLTSRPTRNFNYKLDYTLKDRDSDHDPMDLGPLGYTSRDSRVHEKEQKTFKAEGGYRFPDRSKLRFGYELNEIERTNDTTRDWGGDFAHTTDDTDDNMVWVQYKFAPIGKLNLNFKVEHAERDGDQDQFPEWTSPYNADRDHDKFTINANYPINDKLFASAKFSRTDEEYHIRSDWVDDNDRPYSFRSRDIYSAYFDLTLAATEDLTVSAYVLRESFDWTRWGYERLGSDYNEFKYKSDDDTSAYGVSVNWQVTTKLNLDAELTVSDSDSDLDATYTSVESAGLAVGDKTSQPGSSYDNTRLNVLATYQLDKQWSIFARYLYEDWDAKDWANNGEVDENIGFGWDADDGATNAFIIGARKSF